MFEYWISTDLEQLPSVKTVNGRVFTQDSKANKVGVKVNRNGEPVDLTGSVVANIILPDGSTITESGETDGNKAWIVLPDDAYRKVGQISVFLKLVNGTEVTTLGAVDAYVYKSM